MFDPGQGAGDPAAMMRDLAGSDPRMAMLMQMMQPGSTAAASQPAIDERDDLIARLSEKLDETETRLAKMTRVARQLHLEQQSGARRLTMLAAALGACGVCWGDDPACRACRGRGRPGMVRPDITLRAQVLGKAPSAGRERAPTPAPAPA